MVERDKDSAREEMVGLSVIEIVIALLIRLKK
jgi:hypothetical protein